MIRTLTHENSVNERLFTLEIWYKNTHTKTTL